MRNLPLAQERFSRDHGLLKNFVASLYFECCHLVLTPSADSLVQLFGFLVQRDVVPEKVSPFTVD